MRQKFLRLEALEDRRLLVGDLLSSLVPDGRIHGLQDTDAEVGIRLNGANYEVLSGNLAVGDYLGAGIGFDSLEILGLPDVDFTGDGVTGFSILKIASMVPAGVTANGIPVSQMTFVAPTVTEWGNIVDDIFGGVATLKKSSPGGVIMIFEDGVVDFDRIAPPSTLVGSAATIVGTEVGEMGFTGPVDVNGNVQDNTTGEGWSAVAPTDFAVGPSRPLNSGMLGTSFSIGLSRLEGWAGFNFLPMNSIFDSAGNADFVGGGGFEGYGDGDGNAVGPWQVGSDTDFSFRPVIAPVIDIEKLVKVTRNLPGGGEGLTPGYWKQSHHFDDWVNFSPTDKYNTVFGVNDHPSLTLLGALKRGGGGNQALGRHAVAAILNASHPNIDYDMTVPQIIAAVQDAYATGIFEPLKNQLDAFNNQGADLNTPATGGGMIMTPLVDADSPTGPTARPGDIVTFVYVVTNLGQPELSNVVVTDREVDPVTMLPIGPAFNPPALLNGTFNVGDLDLDNKLDPGEEWRYSASIVAVFNGTGGDEQHKNVADVSGATVSGVVDTDTDVAHWLVSSSVANQVNVNAPVGTSVGNFVTIASAPTLTMFPGGNAGGSTRMKLEFPDSVIRNTWLRVTVFANSNTDLAADDVFYFGNAVGHKNIGNTGLPIVVRTNATDTSTVRRNQLTITDLTSPRDVDRVFADLDTEVSALQLLKRF